MYTRRALAHFLPRTDKNLLITDFLINFYFDIVTKIDQFTTHLLRGNVMQVICVK